MSYNGYEKIVEPHTIPNCRFPCCTATSYRAGLCNRHRKWVQRGYFDSNLVQLKTLPVRMSPTPRCKVCGTTTRIVKSLCMKHYRWMREGIIDNNGTLLRTPKKLNPPGTVCLVASCHTYGKITKGFCKKHYAQLRNKNIDTNGNPLIPLKRIPRYPLNQPCLIPGCTKKPEIRAYCTSHFYKLKRGTIAPDGAALGQKKFINAGKLCSECHTKPAKIKGLCRVHHYKKYKSKGFKNKGKTCSAPACHAPATRKTLCTKHYGRRKARAKATGATNMAAVGY